MLNIFPNVRRLYHEDERAQFDFVQPNVDFKKDYGVSLHEILKNEVWIDTSKCQPKTKVKINVNKFPRIKVNNDTMEPEPEYECMLEPEPELP